MIRYKFSRFFLIFKIVLVVTMAFKSISCRNQNSSNGEYPVQIGNKEELIRNQQQMVQDESIEIEQYISRRNYTMNTTETGLRYMIFESNPNGRQIMDEYEIDISYKVSLLDGATVYSSDSTGYLSVKVGKSDIASGLHEGLKFMREKERALFIVPSHLAYGLTGDGDKIKQYQTLVIDTKVLRIKN